MKGGLYFSFIILSELLFVKSICKSRFKMKPVVIAALSKDLQVYVRTVQKLDQASLLEINKKLLKMQMEVFEILGKIS